MTCSDKVCPQCPFRRKSAPGYLGAMSYDPINFLAPYYHGDQRMACHMKVDWDKQVMRHGRTPEDAPLCRGLIIFLKNSVKLPLNEEVCAAMQTVEKDTETIFNWQHEFVAHHSKKTK